MNITINQNSAFFPDYKFDLRVLTDEKTGLLDEAAMKDVADFYVAYAKRILIEDYKKKNPKTVFDEEKIGEELFTESHFGTLKIFFWQEKNPEEFEARNHSKE
jgi:hypothetical protein